MSDRYDVRLTAGAERDLTELFDYISENDSPGAADQVIDGVIDCIATLSEQPERGHIPEELSGLGMREYRQLHFKPYRILYREIERTVYVYLIADGRRDMQSLLAKRLLG